MRPTLVNFEQGSKEWIAWRNAGIGGSDAPILMYDNNYENPFKLWELKVGVRAGKAINKYMLRGSRVENAAREEYGRQTGNIVAPCCYEHPAFPHLRCSLDGAFPLDDPELVVEIKCPDYIGDHLTAKAGKVPGKYYAQVQHGLMVTGAKSAHYVSAWHKEPLVILEVFPNDYYLGQLLEAEQDFWGWVQEGRFPLLEGELDMEGDEEWMASCRRLKDFEAMLEEAQEKLNAEQAIMKRILGVRKLSARGNGVEVKWTHTVRKAEREPRPAIDTWSLGVRQIPKERVD